MQYRRVGNSGLKVGAIALGGWITFEDLRQSGVREVVRAMLDQGGNFVDLADIYGRGAAEELLGNMMREFRRGDLVLSTKAYWPMSDNINDRGLSRKHLVESLEASLHRLNTPYVDIYFCHRFDEETPIEEVVRAMDHLVRQGKTLYWGTSVWSSEQIQEAVRIARELGCHPPIVEQPSYSLADRHIEAEIIPAVARLGIGLTTWSPLAQGVLTGKYSDGIPRGSRADTNEWVRGQLRDRDIELARRLAPIAAGAGLTMPQLALAWILRRPEVSCAIIGATAREQVEENVKAAEITLTADVLAEIDKVLAALPEPAE
jgi:voltage-dependent potassium channel beta subunit